MLHTQFDGQVLIDGRFVSERISRVIEAINDYDSEIVVQWVPPEARDDGQAAFKIVHMPAGEEPFVLMHVNTEDEFDERILMKIIQNDQRTNPVGLSDLETWEETQRLIAKQMYLDKLEEANDVAFHILNSPLNTYKVNKDLVIKEGIPFNATPANMRKHGMF